MLLEFANWLAYDTLGLDADSRLGTAVSFFIYDTVKIFLLLWVMIFIIGFLRTFLPEARLRAWMAHRGIGGNVIAALFGAITPFCSCSSIPLFISFQAAGIPLGIAFSFLIASPLINEYLVVIMLEAFGWKITALYVASGLFMGVVGGYLLGKLGLERFLEKDFFNKAKNAENSAEASPTPMGWARVRFGWNEANDIVRKIAIWVLVGVGIGALIHGYVPRESMETLMQRTGVFAVPLATLLGVPLYGSCAGIVPVAVALFDKGIPLGTALCFMMAMAALSLPEAVMLRRVMRLNLIALYFALTAVAIMLTGYFINFIHPLL